MGVDQSSLRSIPHASQWPFSYVETANFNSLFLIVPSPFLKPLNCLPNSLCMPNASYFGGLASPAFQQLRNLTNGDIG